MLKKLSLAISTSLVLCGSSAYAAAFDCSKANGYVELTICTTPALSSLDDHLNALYKQVNQAKPENAQLVRKAQLLWLKGVRNKATSAQMIQQAYQSRINDLNMMVSAQQPQPQPQPVTSSVADLRSSYDCDLLIQSEYGGFLSKSEKPADYKTTGHVEFRNGSATLTFRIPEAPGKLVSTKLERVECNNKDGSCISTGTIFSNTSNNNELSKVKLETYKSANPNMWFYQETIDQKSKEVIMKTLWTLNNCN